MSLQSRSCPVYSGEDRIERAGRLVKEYPDNFPDFRASYHMFPDKEEMWGIHLG